MTIAAGVALSAAGLLIKTLDWHAAGQACDTLRTEVVQALRRTSGNIEVYDVPGTLRGVHFGYGIGFMVGAPFLEPELADRARLVVDLAARHAGSRRSVSVVEACAATAGARAGVDHYCWDRRRNRLVAALIEPATASIRGLAQRDTSGRLRLRCTELSLEGEATRDPPTRLGQWTGTVATIDAMPVLEVAGVEPVAPSLDLSDDDTGSVRLRLHGSDAAGYLVFAGRARGPKVLGDLGVLLVDAQRPMALGFLDAAGAAELRFTPPDRAALRVQVVLLGADGVIVFSECGCLFD